MNWPLKDKEWKSRVDLIDPETLLEIWQVLRLWAEKYRENSWQNVPIKDHIWSALRHIYKYQMWQEIDNETWMNHILHAMTNLMFVNYNSKYFTKEED